MDVALDHASLSAITDLVMGDAMGQVSLAVQAFVGLLMIGCAVWTALRPGRTRAVAFVACAVVWARANHGLEGFVLVTVSPEHGLTVADLLPPALLALVLARLAVTGRGVRETARHSSARV
jgi:hypothetical protein